MTDKKTLITSTAEAHRIIAGSDRNITPPAHVALVAEEMPFFDSIIAEGIKADWTDHNIECAALLARAMSSLAKEQEKLRNEGSVIETKQGITANPRKVQADKSIAAITSLRRSLSLHARAQGGEARDIAKRRALAKEYEDFDDPHGMFPKPDWE